MAAAAVLSAECVSACLRLRLPTTTTTTTRRRGRRRRQLFRRSAVRHLVRLFRAGGLQHGAEHAVSDSCSCSSSLTLSVVFVFFVVADIRSGTVSLWSCLTIFWSGIQCVVW